MCITAHGLRLHKTPLPCRPPKTQPVAYRETAMTRSLDTIAATATAPGYGGIAVVRISGPLSLPLLERLFLPRRGRDGFAFRPRYMHYGFALDAQGGRLDDVLAVFMPGPFSSTGEDVGEIHCHGGPAVTSAVLEALLDAGARLADPGEFTRRAFLNGRIDLTQAEAVAELISAPGREGVRLAAAKLDGVLAREVEQIRQGIDALRAQAILAVDFPDEGAELLPREAFLERLTAALEGIGRLLGGFSRARYWREGAVVVLAGSVNAGKSSLLNALVGRARAIVSAEPGTTRDYIEEMVNINGLPLRVIDTAGLREGGDMIEEEGIRRSRDLAAEADAVLLVADVSGSPAREELDFMRTHRQLLEQGRLLLVLNKADAVSRERGEAPLRETVLRRFSGVAESETERGGWEKLLSGAPCFLLSAKAGQGLDALGDGIRAALGCADVPSGGDVAPNLRQSGLLKQARNELEALLPAFEAGMPPDILSVHLDAAADALAAVTGASGTEELLDAIFSSFCIGK